MKIRNRGFEKVSKETFLKDVNLTEQDYNQIVLPVSKTQKSAGYDFSTPIDITLLPGESTIIPTGIKAYMLDDEYLSIYIRSSMGTKKDVILKNQVGIIDADYYNNSGNEGHILIAIRNIGNNVFEAKKGDAIAQGIFQKYLTVDEDDKVIKKVRQGGVGSTGV